MKRSLLLLLAVVLSLPAAAQLPNNEFGLAIGKADMPGFGDAGTLAITYNRFFRPSLSTEFALVGYGAELNVVDLGPGQEGPAGDLAMGAFTGKVQYHFLRGRTVSPHVGAGLAFVSATLVDTPFGDIDADSDLTWTIGAGVDLNLSRRWAIGADVDYIPYDAEFPPVASIDMDPTTISAGVKFRW